MKTIQLTQGKYAIIDDDDYEELSRYKWHASLGSGRYWRARRNIKKGNEKWILESMSRKIMNAPVGTVVDHLNGDTLDNRKENLRLCDQSINGQNRHSTHGLSCYQGVSWDAGRAKWRARIMKDGIKYSLGLYNREKEAAFAYNKGALKIYDNPKLNKIKAIK